MALPKTGITTSMVGSALGVSSRNVGALCTNNNINMWSRKKPIHIANAASVDRTGMWWKGTNGDCGISLDNARANSYNQLKSKYETYNNNGWEYSPPWGDRGGVVKSPFRLGDFIEYKHDATSPISAMWVPAQVKKDGLLRVSFAIGMVETEKTGPGSVRFDDIMPAGATENLNKYYVGIVVYDGNTLKGRVTSTGVGTSAIVEYSTAGMSLGSSYQVYPFIAKYKMAQLSTDVVNEYYTLPDVKAGEFKVVSAEQADGITIDLRATTMYNNGEKTGINYVLKISGKTNITLKNNHIQMRLSTNKPLDPFMVGERTRNLGDIQVVPNTTKEYNGSFIINDSNKYYYIYLTLDTARYTRQIYPLDIPIMN